MANQEDGMEEGRRNRRHNAYLHNAYLVAQDHPDNNFDHRLAQYDELRREGELARLKDRIQSAIDEYYEWGQFEVWWQNPARAIRLDLGTRTVTFSHDDRGLRRILALYNHCPASKERVERAWRLLVRRFNVDRHEEQWNRDDWHPGDERGPHRHGV